LLPVTIASHRSIDGATFFKVAPFSFDARVDADADTEVEIRSAVRFDAAFDLNKVSPHNSPSMKFRN
jgi:hypothetical protein